LWRDLMAENTNIAEADFSMAVNNDAVYLLSQEFERDSRRYNRWNSNSRCDMSRCCNVCRMRND